MLFGGVKFTVGEDEIVIPAISLGQLRNGILTKLQEHDKLVAEGKFFDSMTIRGEIILAAIRRNYPDFEEAKLFDFLDLANTGRVWQAVLGVSGLGMGETQAEVAPNASATTPGT